ncbi:MAG: tRNA adenosine(34) deaminase TadA [Anaerovoracaceae bacterium]|nr:tRNA adenosine(34) deaminase TadA [Anaerovoracaceae bacterium]
MKKYMAEALAEAGKAAAAGEVPIGAVVVKDGRIVGRGHNLTITDRDCTRHAEMVALRDAMDTLGSGRLTGCEMYVTVEPCAMCAGAIVLSRIEKLCIGTEDPKAGACGSVFNVVQEERLNHRVEVEAGIMREECAGIISGFFRELRRRNGENNE